MLCCVTETDVKTEQYRHTVNLRNLRNLTFIVSFTSPNIHLKLWMVAKAGWLTKLLALIECLKLREM